MALAKKQSLQLQFLSYFVFLFHTVLSNREALFYRIQAILLLFDDHKLFYSPDVIDDIYTFQ